MSDDLRCEMCIGPVKRERLRLQYSLRRARSVGMAVRQVELETGGFANCCKCSLFANVITDS